MKRERTPSALAAASLLTAVLMTMPVVVAGANECDPGEQPDVIIGAIFDHENYGTQDGATGFAIGTESCNVGTCHLDWLSGTPFHPVIAQNMYRLQDGRFTQIGVGWLKHGFATLNNNLCGTCIPDDGQHLGVNCSDPYWAGLNGAQNSLGPRFEVNAEDGTHLHPYTYQGWTDSDPNYKRISVKITDLDPDLNPGALYFVEGQYVTKDDAEAGNHQNNNAYRQIIPNASGTDFSLTGPTFQQDPALLAWEASGDGKVEWIDGQLLGGYEIIDLGDGFWRYSYAIQNVISERSVRAVRISLPHGVALRNVGFADADYHSGEPFDLTDWAVVHESGPTVHNHITWSTEPFDIDENANALRWGTVYTFWFEADVGPTPSGPGVTSPQAGQITYFKPGGPPTTGWVVKGPARCGDAFCDIDETALNCSQDCAALPPAGEVQGSQMTVALEENDDLILTWGESCALGDSDYGVYEGFIGDFASHNFRICSTGGQTSATFTPAGDGTYYLVVPHNTIAEGSYGSDSAGNPRPAGQTVCLQQEIEPCK